MTNKNTEKSEDLYGDYGIPQPYEEDIEIAYGNYLIAQTGLYKDKKAEDLTHEEIKEMERQLPHYEEDIEIAYGNYLIAQTGLYKDKKAEDLTSKEIREMERQLPHYELTYEDLQITYAEHLQAQTGLYKDKDAEELTDKEIKEMEIELEDMFYPKKQITVKLYPETHKNLKIRSTTEDTTLDKMASTIVENRIHNFDIVRYVEKEFNTIDDSLGSYIDDMENGRQEDIRTAYDIISNFLEEKGETSKPMKRINVKVYHTTHKKLGVIGAIENKSLGSVVSSILEEEFGEIDIRNEREKIEGKAKDLLDKDLEKREEISNKILNYLKATHPEIEKKEKVCEILLNYYRNAPPEKIISSLKYVEKRTK